MTDFTMAGFVRTSFHDAATYPCMKFLDINATFPYFEAKEIEGVHKIVDYIEGNDHAVAIAEYLMDKKKIKRDDEFEVGWSCDFEWFRYKDHVHKDHMDGYDGAMTDFSVCFIDYANNQFPDYSVPQRTMNNEWGETITPILPNNNTPCFILLGSKYWDYWHQTKDSAQKYVDADTDAEDDKKTTESTSIGYMNIFKIKTRFTKKNDGDFIMFKLNLPTILHKTKDIFGNNVFWQKYGTSFTFTRTKKQLKMLAILNLSILLFTTFCFLTLVLYLVVKLIKFLFCCCKRKK